MLSAQIFEKGFKLEFFTLVFDRGPTSTKIVHAHVWESEFWFECNLLNNVRPFFDLYVLQKKASSANCFQM